MACSVNRVKIQQPASFRVSHGQYFSRLSSYHYVHALLEEEVTKKITKVIWSTLDTFANQGISSLVVQFLAATKCSTKVHLLTTTCQPYGVLGVNKELEEYRINYLHHKLYVYKDTKNNKGVAFGLSGLAFLKRAIQHDQIVHGHLNDPHPSCKNANSERKWGSYAVPVIDFAGKCYGVLQFITDTPKDSFDDEIRVVSHALQYAGLQFVFPCNPPNELEMIGDKERKRTTDTSDVTTYRSLVPFMGLEKDIAMKKLGQASAAKKDIKRSTFRNLRKNVGIPEWPYIENTSVQATCVLETQAVPETSTFRATPSANLTSFMGDGFPKLPMDDMSNAEEAESEFPFPVSTPECFQTECQNDNVLSMDNDNSNADWIFGDIGIDEQSCTEAMEESRPVVGGDMGFNSIDLDSIDWV